MDTHTDAKVQTRISMKSQQTYKFGRKVKVLEKKKYVCLLSLTGLNLQGAHDDDRDDDGNGNGNGNDDGDEEDDSNTMFVNATVLCPMSDLVFRPKTESDASEPHHAPYCSGFTAAHPPH